MKKASITIAVGILVLGVAAVVAVAVLLWPKLSNMSSEYETARAITDIEAFLEKNNGRWPSSPQDLEHGFPPETDVMINFSTTSSELLANPAELKNAVRPRSGKFLTYPYYERDIENLRVVLKETNPIATP